MNILFYYPDKERAVSLSSLMISFKKQGHKVFLLTHSKKGDLHQMVEKEGVSTFNYFVTRRPSLIFFVKHIFYLISFTKKNKIDLVYSHIQVANFISCIARFFSPSKFIFCRHHSDCAFVDNNRNEKIMDKIINYLGTEFIVPSDKVYEQMVKKELVGKKIHVIRYAYIFEEYPQPDPVAVSQIREKYKCKLLLIKIARLIPEKRHIILFETVNKLVKNGADVKLIVLSEGSERTNLENFIERNGLQDRIFLLGFKRDVMNFISAADLVIHISETEASNSLVKEAGLLEKPVLVCNDVGDFDEYMENNRNGFVISKKNPAPDLQVLLERIYSKETDLTYLGKQLHKTVRELFSIGNILHKYNQFHS